ncbi:glycosyltransferase [Acinetobacter indicus]|uniref:glycosyltransferase n=1 Tax=Acinetobacter indicus TaxID=756892 RepID=UPI000CEC978B|nr:glycosyltransferase [Acinetobacter indicus]
MNKFSVLCSIYIKENPEYFDICLKSTWDQQTLLPSEIVLVEDGPLTVELYEIIEIWKKKLGDILKIVKLPINQGTGKAKNIGLKYCTNEIVCIVDTDDINCSDRFEKQLNFFKNNPDITIVGGQIIEFTDNVENFQGIRSVPLTHHELVNYSNSRSPFNNMTIAYRKSAVIAVGGYQHHLLMEDYNLFLRLIASKKYKLHNLPDILVYARIDNGMHGRRNGWKYIQSEKQLLDLKKSLKLQKSLPANILFILRSAFRLLPSTFLAKVYNTFLRKKSR